MVWLTAMGLPTVMVVCLLWVIFVNGITVFWPKPVYQLELDANSTHRVSAETNVFAGAITMDREITGADDGTREYQFFVGNKDIYGFMYKFVPQADLVESDRTKLTQPKDIMVAERLEYGNAIFYPVSMQPSPTRCFGPRPRDFTTKLYALVEECNERRAKYTALAKKTSAASITPSGKLIFRSRR